MELRDYLNLERRAIPWVYMNAIYSKLKIELLEEIENEQLSNLEDIQAAVDEYNDKWNAIRDEYIKVFNTDGAPLPIDYFKEHYWEETKLKKQDTFFGTDMAENQDFTEMGDDIYESE